MELLLQTSQVLLECCPRHSSRAFSIARAPPSSPLWWHVELIVFQCHPPHPAQPCQIVRGLRLAHLLKAEGRKMSLTQLLHRPVSTGHGRKTDLERLYCQTPTISMVKTKSGRVHCVKCKLRGPLKGRRASYTATKPPGRVTAIRLSSATTRGGPCPLTSYMAKGASVVR